MPRPRANVPLNIFLNGRLVGRLTKQASGAIDFTYDPGWLAWDNALPVSLSLPLRENRYIGEPVLAVFENLLPDSKPIRTRVAERVGAGGTDAYSMLAKIGRDCVGALQFLPDGEAFPGPTGIAGEPVDEGAIEQILLNLERAPLGLDADDDFRISVAGAQEKTALLWHEGKWLKPFGTTPTTHLLKPQIGHIHTAGGIVDLTNSVENEYYCLALLRAFGLDTCNAEIATFGAVKALVVERFDRRWTRDGRLIRLPQEDFCQALSVPPTAKYQNEGGPGIAAIAGLLQGSDDPAADRLAFFKSQILFWLIGATDGHAKNFSIFLRPGGRFALTPFYDVLTAQPSLDAHQIQWNRFKLAMAVGANRHYRIRDIHGRHFVETGKEAGLAPGLVRRAIEETSARAEQAFALVEAELPAGFPEAIHLSVKGSALVRLRSLVEQDHA